MSQFGTFQAIQEETWAKHYRCNVSNVVKIVTMTLTKHIPSYVVIDGHTALISYDGQPKPWYGLGDTDHMYHACSKRLVVKSTTPALRTHRGLTLRPPQRLLPVTSEFWTKT
jgi:hypothetical protein